MGYAGVKSEHWEGICTQLGSYWYIAVCDAWVVALVRLGDAELQ